MKISFKEQLKNAICNNDLAFFEQNKGMYSIDDRFEDENNDTLLLYAISFKDSFAYKYFFNNGANINLVNDEKENIIHAIIYSGIGNRLQEFLDKYPTHNINNCTIDGATPLLLSISLGYIEMAKMLINKGADVTIGDENGITPLHLAVQLDDLSFVVSLIEKGAVVNKKTKNGNYPLALAINGDRDEIVKYLYHILYKTHQ